MHLGPISYREPASVPQAEETEPEPGLSNHEIEVAVVYGQWLEDCKAQKWQNIRSIVFEIFLIPITALWYTVVMLACFPVDIARRVVYGRDFYLSEPTMVGRAALLWFSWFPVKYKPVEPWSSVADAERATAENESVDAFRHPHYQKKYQKALRAETTWSRLRNSDAAREVYRRYLKEKYERVC